MNGEQNMGHRFELSKRHERKIKFELNSRVRGFHFLTRSARWFSIVSRGLRLSSAAARKLTMNLRRAEQFSPAAPTACITSHKFELSRHGLVAFSHLLITSDEHKLLLLAHRPTRTLLPALKSEAKLKNLVYVDVQTACLQQQRVNFSNRRTENF